MSFTHISVLLIGFGFMAINLIIHACFMFLILKSQSYYLRNYPHLKGIASIVGPLLAATFLIIISCSIQVILWSLLVFDFGKFDDFFEALHFSGTTYTTLGSGKQYLVPPLSCIRTHDCLHRDASYWLKHCYFIRSAFKYSQKKS